MMKCKIISFKEKETIEYIEAANISEILKQISLKDFMFIKSIDIKEIITSDELLSEAEEVINDLLKTPATYGFRFAIGARENAENFLKKYQDYTVNKTDEAMGQLKEVITSYVQKESIK